MSFLITQHNTHHSSIQVHKTSRKKTGKNTRRADTNTGALPPPCPLFFLDSKQSKAAAQGRSAGPRGELPLVTKVPWIIFNYNQGKKRTHVTRSLAAEMENLSKSIHEHRLGRMGPNSSEVKRQGKS